MITESALRELSTAIARDFAPHKIILFGSYAAGNPREDSDVDLLVVMDYAGSSVGRAAEVARTIRGPFDVDILVRSPAEVESRLSLNDRFIKGIIDRGRVLYESPDR